MPKILFWNTNSKKVDPEIVRLCITYDVDVLILAESNICEEELLGEVNKKNRRKLYADLNISPRLKFYSAYPRSHFLPVLDDDYCSIRTFQPYVGPKLLLVAVHLPSKLHAEPLDQLVAAQRVSKNIREAEQSLNIEHTVAIGDFNMSPFEDGMVAASGMHAVLDREIALKGGRILKKNYFPFFYNPMWGRLGDLTSGPPGTFRYSKAVEVNHYWHTFDQVLLRPSLLKFFSAEDVTVLERAGSDHSPLLLNLKTEII